MYAYIAAMIQMTCATLIFTEKPKVRDIRSVANVLGASVIPLDQPSHANEPEAELAIIPPSMQPHMRRSRKYRVFFIISSPIFCKT